MTTKNKRLNLAGIIATIHHDKKTVDLVNFKPTWRQEYDSIPGAKEQGYAIEWLVNAYFMMCPHEGKHYNVFNESLEPIKSFSDIDLGKRGRVGRPAPDVVLQNKKTKNYYLISCKNNKKGFHGAEIGGLEIFAALREKLGSSTEYAYATMASNAKLSKSEEKYINHVFGEVELSEMWKAVYDRLKNSGWSLRNIENEARKPIKEKDAVQKYLMQQLKTKFEKHDRVWLNAIMRSGKSYLFAMTASELKANKIVLLSHFPTDTFKQWKNIFNGALQYKDFEIFNADECRTKDVQKSKKYVLICSAQRIKMNSEWKKFFRTSKFDFVGLDEVHHGFDTEDMQDIIENVKTKKWLFMSGTMDILRSRGYIDQDAAIEWTYLDTMLCKKGHNAKLDRYTTSPGIRRETYRKFKSEADYPTLNIAHFEPDQMVIDKLKELGNEETIQTWDKIYGNPAVLKEIVKLLLGGPLVTSQTKFRKVAGEGSPVRSAIDVAHGHHMIAWFCPDRKAQHAVKAVIEEIWKDKNSELKNYIPKIFNSDPNDEKNDGKFRNDIRKLERTKKKCILILCGQGTTGVTYEDLPVVIIGKDSSSVTNYLQICFRVMSSMPTACERWVYDLSFGHVFVDNIRGLIDNNSIDHTDKDRLKWLFESINIFDNKVLGRWDYDKFEEKRREAFRGNAAYLLGSTVRYLGNIGNLDILDEFDFNGAHKKNILGEIGEALSKGRSFFKDTEKKKKGKKKDKQSEKEQKEAEEKERCKRLLLMKLLIKTISANIDLFMDVNASEAAFPEKLDIAASNKNFTEMFNKQVAQLGLEINWKDIKSAFYDNCAKNHDVCDNMDLIISFVKDCMKNGKSIGDLIGMDELSKKTFAEVYTPESLVDQMLDKIPEEVWSNPDLKWIDNSCGTGVFLWHGVIPRLMKGLARKIPNEQDRKKHIAGMIYGVDIQDTNIGIARGYMVHMLGSENLKTIKEHIVCANSLEFGYWGGMKFDVVVGNPPYQDNSGNTGAGHMLWTKFVELALNKLLEKNGYLTYVHPAGWRQIDNKLGKLLRNKNMLYLEIHNAKDGQKTFKANTRYDWYICQNSDCKQKTVVRDQNGKEISLDLRKWSFIPNCVFKEIEKLIQNSEEKIAIAKNCAYHTARKDRTSIERTSEFRYPIINHISMEQKLALRWSSRNDLGHFGIPKVIFQNAFGTGMIVDYEGKYGMTQWCSAIVDEPKNLESIAKALNSPKFKEIIKAIAVRNEINVKVLKLFKKDFWKDFI